MPPEGGRRVWPQGHGRCHMPQRDEGPPNTAGIPSPVWVGPVDWYLCQGSISTCPPSGLTCVSQNRRSDMAVWGRSPGSPHSETPRVQYVLCYPTDCGCSCWPGWVLGDWVMERSGSTLPGALSVKPEYLILARRCGALSGLGMGHCPS